MLNAIYTWIIENWETTAAGAIAAALIFLFGFEGELADNLTVFITALGLFLIGLLAKDADSDR